MSATEKPEEKKKGKKKNGRKKSEKEKASELEPVDASWGADQDVPGYQEEIEVKVVPTAGKTDVYELAPVLDLLSWDQGFFHALQAIEMLRERNGMKNIVTVGIAGPTGAGKSTMAAKFKDVLGAHVVNLEDFVVAEKVVEGNTDDPNAYDFAGVQKLLSTLKAGEHASVPVINPISKARTGWVAVDVPQSRVIVLEGSYALNTAVRHLLDVTIAINGGVHLDLIKRVVGDIGAHSKHITPEMQKESLFRVTNVVFPMFKAFIEPDIQAAKIRIHSTYNPISALMNPIYVSKSKYSVVESRFNSYFSKQHSPISTTSIADMYFYPPKYDPNSMYKADRRNWLRIRRSEGLFQISFYNEMMDATVNIRPSLNFEINVQTISGLLSLGYQIGAILHRTIEVWHDEDDCIITKEYIKELGKHYVQIKGQDRSKVISIAEELDLLEHHVPQTFLYLYFRKLRKPAEPSATVSGTGSATGSAIGGVSGITDVTETIPQASL